jgi:hypothetical protein
MAQKPRPDERNSLTGRIIYRRGCFVAERSVALVPSSGGGRRRLDWRSCDPQVIVRCFIRFHDTADRAGFPLSADEISVKLSLGHRPIGRRMMTFFMAERSPHPMKARRVAARRRRACRLFFQNPSETQEIPLRSPPGIVSARSAAEPPALGPIGATPVSWDGEKMSGKVALSNEPIRWCGRPPLRRATNTTPAAPSRAAGVGCDPHLIRSRRDL